MVSFGNLVVWPFSFRKSPWQLLAAGSARAVQMPKWYALRVGIFPNIKSSNGWCFLDHKHLEFVNFVYFLICSNFALSIIVFCWSYVLVKSMFLFKSKQLQVGSRFHKTIHSFFWMYDTLFGNQGRPFWSGVLFPMGSTKKICSSPYWSYTPKIAGRYFGHKGCDLSPLWILFFFLNKFFLRINLWVCSCNSTYWSYFPK